MLSLLSEIGIVVAGGMAPAPIGWRDIEAWQGCTGVRLPPWQSRLLVELSREYVGFLREAEKPECREPWLDQPVEERNARIAEKLSAFCRSLVKQKD